MRCDSSNLTCHLMLPSLIFSVILTVFHYPVVTHVIYSSTCHVRHHNDGGSRTELSLLKICAHWYHPCWLKTTKAFRPFVANATKRGLEYVWTCQNEMESPKIIVVLLFILEILTAAIGWPEKISGYVTVSLLLARNIDKTGKTSQTLMHSLEII